MVATETPARSQQASFDEEPLDDPNIEAALLDWERRKEDVADAREKERDAYQILQGLIGKKELDEGDYRCGPFVVKITPVAAHQRVKAKRAKT